MAGGLDSIGPAVMIKTMTLLKKIWRPLLALTLILVLLKKGPFDLNQLKLIFQHPSVIMLGLALMLAQILLLSLRWKLFIGLSANISFLRVFRLNLIGLFFNYFIPGGVGGDIVKALELSKDQQLTKSEALSTVLSDRIFGLFAMVTFTLLFLAIDYWLTGQQYILKFLFLSATLFTGISISLLFFPYIFSRLSSYLTSRNTKLLNKLEKLVSSLDFTFRTFRRLKIQLLSFSISLVGQMMAIYFMYEVTKTVGVTPPSFLVFFSLCCFSFVASAIPIFPAGIGVGQAAMYVMFANISPELGTASITAITALQIFNLFYALIGGVFFSFMPKIKLEEGVINDETNN